MNKFPKCCYTPKNNALARLAHACMSSVLHDRTTVPVLPHAEAKKVFLKDNGDIKNRRLINQRPELLHNQARLQTRWCSQYQILHANGSKQLGCTHSSFRTFKPAFSKSSYMYSAGLEKSLQLACHLIHTKSRLLHVFCTPANV